MSTTTRQSIIVLLVASFFVVAVWYLDREVKNIHTNIKIIQNMLKTVIANQNNSIYQDTQDLHAVNIVKKIIPETIQYENVLDSDNDPVSEKCNDEIEKAELSDIKEEEEDDIDDQESIIENNEIEIQEDNKFPETKIEETKIDIQNTVAGIVANIEESVKPQPSEECLEETPKKKRGPYKKKAQSGITV